MEETIKGIEVIAYKGMKLNMACLGFQYKIGETYKTDKVKLCECGFHACLNPIDVLYYYPKEEHSRYFKVKLSGEITKCDFDGTHIAATEITILEEITDSFDVVIKTTEWWKTENVLDLLYYQEGFAKVRREDGLWNFIDKQGNILSDKWFNYLEGFNEGFGILKRSDELYNFIDKNGNILSKEWFKLLTGFYEGFAVVQRSDGLCNFIDKQGKYLFDKWYKDLNKLNEQFVQVRNQW